MYTLGSLANLKYKEKHIEWVATVDKIKRQVFHIAELCTGVGYGKSASPFLWGEGGTGASSGKIVILEFLKSALQCTAFE